MNMNPTRTSLYEAFCDPLTHCALEVTGHRGLKNGDGTTYKFLDGDESIVDFLATTGASAADVANLKMYDDQSPTERYRNFLRWLFQTFKVSEAEFRTDLLARLKISGGMKVLVIGCGLGEDVAIIHQAIGAGGELHAQDISKSMVKAASDSIDSPNVCFSISNALSLPYKSRYFDVVFHFGGINLFGNMQKAIAELERVCKIGGRVMFGDEGIAPHLRGTEYANILINNNGLWALEAPMHQLPHNAAGIEITYVLGNCFYLISFRPQEGLPKVDLDVPHVGTRGGSARTRYFGRLEGVTPETKDKLVEAARARGISAHALLEEIINRQIPSGQ
ncbi:class I SAM-dependent methyltransferase [Variovorax ginsengisoli]|uniref:Methyltransferase domain-containing protein n=1 Tax=Variovorax ginsengisoli TaxID=363844 RepID=A0ABT8S3R2_9BURK|nr:methyltransferase domain-containing protein [Variovorax ginsengisoli]MDN8612826.1 methyltransferase domain-containing protein [Variovorax ginsengisoli]MDO1531996.1 methyltransferase domain-containing protein [Variovorax ginsengisoli]